MPSSTSSALATPSAIAKHASFTSDATIRARTSPGASPTHATCSPSVPAKRSAAATVASDEPRAAGELEQAAGTQGRDGREADGRAAELLRGERALRAQEHPRRALQRLGLVAAGVDRDERHLAVRVAWCRDAPARVPRELRQLDARPAARPR